jgi:hypothetical protein
VPSSRGANGPAARILDEGCFGISVAHASHLFRRAPTINFLRVDILSRRFWSGDFFLPPFSRSAAQRPHDEIELTGRSGSWPRASRLVPRARSQPPRTRDRKCSPARGPAASMASLPADAAGNRSRHKQSIAPDRPPRLQARRAFQDPLPSGLPSRL